MGGDRERGRGGEGRGPVKRLAVIFDNRDRLTTSIVIPNRDDGPVLSSAIILENNGWNEIPSLSRPLLSASYITFDKFSI